MNRLYLIILFCWVMFAIASAQELTVKEMKETNDLSAVKTKHPNELGLFDMSGNVWGWCQDKWGDYKSGSQTNPNGPSSGSSRVIRGGCWGVGPQFCRSPHRASYNPSHGFDNIGLRLAL